MIALPLFTSMVWPILIVIGLLILFLLVDRRVLNNKIKASFKKSDSMQKQFNHHFKVTDNTIVEERKEKKYWKNRATKAEKLLVD